MFLKEEGILTTLGNIYYNESPRDIKRIYNENSETVLNKTVTKLFNDIKKKCLKVDTKIIDSSKGDITKVDGYEGIKNGISFLLKTSNDVSNPSINNAITQLQLCHQSLLNNKKAYMTGYKVKNTVIEYLYTTTAINLIISLSYVISITVEDVTDGMGGHSLRLNGNKSIPKNTALSSITKYNQMDKNGTLVKVMTNTLKLREDAEVVLAEANLLSNLKKIGQRIEKRDLFGDDPENNTNSVEDNKKSNTEKLKQIVGDHKVLRFSIITIVALVSALAVIRTAYYLYNSMRVKLSNYLEYLSNFLMLNSQSITDSQVKERQQKRAEQFKEWSKKIALDQDNAGKKAEKDEKQDDKDSSLSDDEFF